MAVISELWQLDEEDSSEYSRGGYLRIEINHIFKKRFKVNMKLGWGNFSTVWSCTDLRRQEEVAVKVLKSSEDVTAAGLEEVAMLNHLDAMEINSQGRDGVVRLITQFMVEQPTGEHLCLVLEPLGANLLDCFDKRGPMNLKNVRVIVMQVLRALDFLHTKAAVIHCDIKPENVMLVNNGRRSLVDEILGLRVKLGDLGSACHVGSKDARGSIGTLQYQSPEVVLEAGYGPETDIWSTACMGYELATSQYLFNPEADPEEKHTQTEEHLAQIIELCGDLPRELVMDGRCWKSLFRLDAKTPKNFQNKQLRPLLERLEDDLQGVHNQQIREFSETLVLMLAPDPKKRATAEASAENFLRIFGEECGVEGGVKKEKVGEEIDNDELSNNNVEVATSSSRGEMATEQTSGGKKQRRPPTKKIIRMTRKEETEGQALGRITGLYLGRHQRLELPHRTAPGLAALDSQLPEVFREVSKRGLCSVRAMVRYFGEHYPGHGIEEGKRWKLRQALLMGEVTGRLVRVSGRGLTGSLRLAERRDRVAVRKM